MSGNQNTIRQRPENFVCTFFEKNGFDIFEEPKETGIVEHLEDLSVCIGNLFTSSEQSDIILVFDDGTEIKAHRLVLAAWSTCFHAMLYCGYQESNQEKVMIRETNSTAFRAILQYMYSSKIDLTKVELDMLLEYLTVAHRYDLNKLVESISNYLSTILKIENVCCIFNAAYFFQLDKLIDHCMQYADANADQLLGDLSFKKLTSNSLKKLIGRDSFYANEFEIFTAILFWIKNNSENEAVVQELLSLVRLSLIPQTQLLNQVRSTGLMKPDDLLDAIKIQTEDPKKIQHRGYKCNDENYLASKYPRHPPLDPESARKFTSDETINVYLIDLGKPHIINMIKFSLSDIDVSYYDVHVSLDNDPKGDWKLVADYKKYDCRGDQKIYLDPTVARYCLIKVKDRHTLMSKEVQFKVYYVSEPRKFDPETKIVIPSSNVATMPENASVTEGVSRARNALINGDYQLYDSDSGYTCHQIGRGHIMIQLAQPYMLSTMRMLLWDLDDRYYSYYIAVSTNQTDWITVVDRTQEECRGWQELLFNETPVVYIKLVGTKNSMNEVFHVVHFETPSTVPVPF